MSVAPSPARVTAESIDQRIARLKAELADAELQKLDDEMGEAAGAFLGVSQEGGNLVEIRSAIDFARDAWKRFEMWRVAHRSESAEIATERPLLALSPIVSFAPGPGGPTHVEVEAGPVVALADAVPDPAPSSPPDGAGDLQPQPSRGRTRARGTGSVLKNGAGFRWTLARNGVVLRGRTWPTREEAEAELNRAVADPTFVPAPRSTRAILAATESGDDLRRDDAVSVRERSPVSGCFTPSTPAPATRFSIRGELDENDRGGAARRKTNDHRRIEAASAAASPPAADAVEDDVAEEEDDAGWSPPDADGRQTCLPCGGEGIDNRPGEGVGRCCLNCDGDGYRWPEGETAPAAPPPAATPAAEPPPVPPAPASRPPAMPPPAAVVSRPAFFHPGRGWGPLDAAGVSVHVLCNGTGKIRVKGVARGCFPCQGSGKRQCVPTSAPAEGRMP